MRWRLRRRRDREAAAPRRRRARRTCRRRSSVASARRRRRSRSSRSRRSRRRAAAAASITARPSTSTSRTRRSTTCSASSRDTGHVNIVVPESINAQGHGPPQARAVGPGARGHPRVARPVVPPRRQPLPHRAAQGARRRGRGRGRAPRAARDQGRVAARRDRPAQLRVGRRSSSDEARADAVAEGQDRGRRAHELADHQRRRAATATQITQLALALDTQTPQISIEARIVEAQLDVLAPARRPVGWSRARRRATAATRPAWSFPSSVALAGGNEDAQTNRNRRRGAVGLRGQPAGRDRHRRRWRARPLARLGRRQLQHQPPPVGARGRAARCASSRRRRSPCSTTRRRRSARACRSRSRSCRPPARRRSSSRPTSRSTVTPYVSQRDCAIAMNARRHEERARLRQHRRAR